MNTLLRIPHEPLKTAFDAVRRAGAIHADVDRAIAELEPVSLETHGSVGVERRAAELGRYGQDKVEATALAVAGIDAAEAEYTRRIDGQTVPDGTDTQLADYRLFRDQLISTPEQLTVIMERNGNKYRAAFRAAALKLAAKNDWKEAASNYDTHVQEKLVRDYGREYFQLCRSAAKNPGGYNAMVLASDGFTAEYAEKSGVGTEYAAGAE